MRVAGPAQPVEELLAGDQLAGGDLVDGAFLCGRGHRIPWHRAALPVHQLVGEGAAPLGLRQRAPNQIRLPRCRPIRWSGSR